MVNFIRDHKNWCRTCTSFEKELRRYFHWEESEKVSTDVEHIHYTPFEKELRRYFHLRRLNIFQHFDLRRHWEGFLFEKDLRSMELLQSSWDGFEKVRWIWEGNVPSPKSPFSGLKLLKCRNISWHLHTVSSLCLTIHFAYTFPF